VVQPKPKRTKPSTVRHTRAIQRDRSKRATAGPPATQVQDRLAAVVHPATYAQLDAYRAMGLRQRLLTLPVMVAFVLSLIWRQIGSVSEAVRVLQEEGVLWVPPLEVSAQAVNQRLRTLPPHLFQQVLLDVLPQMDARWRTRTAARERPLPPVMRRALEHFPAIVAVDGSTLDVLLRKVGLLREADGPVLAGRMAALLDVATCLPRQVWYEADSQAHDQRFWTRILAALAPGSLVLFDLGFLNYTLFDHLTTHDVHFVTRAKQNTAYRVERTLAWHADRFDQLVWVGSGRTRCQHLLRLVAVQRAGKWYRYLTNVLDPQVLSLEDVVALYAGRWTIEDVYAVVKRLLGLAYFYVGAVNAIQTQLWATWLLYAVLVDLTDAVAATLHQPFVALSIEMVYRGLYHFTRAVQRGQADDPVAYLAAKANRLGLLKRPPRHLTSAPDP
jgi:hypothetical protein